jgi:lipoprotein-anchoring transpeptidase ErfK/SrfK
MLTAACGGGGGKGGGLALAGDSAGKVTVTPATGTKDVTPDSPVQVSVAGGKIDQVSVTGGQGTVTGSLDATHRSWQSTGYLTPGTSYTVSVTAESKGHKKETTTSTFQTLTPKNPLKITDVTPDLPGEKVGVGMPIMVTFNHSVKDRAAVEKALTVTAQKGDVGAWRWIAGDQVVFRTKDYWQPHQTVTFDAKLAGVPDGRGGYGIAETTKTINIGYAQISRVSIPRGRMVVTRDGATVRSFDISGGSGDTREYTTTSGIHLTMDKENPVTMTSPGRQPGDPGYYKVTENWAVRISNSGEYVHESDPSSPSHGCIHAATDNAEWFYDNSQRGDPVIVTGTDRSLPWDNGWGFWQLSWTQWQSGSALQGQSGQGQSGQGQDQSGQSQGQSGQDQSQGGQASS